MSGHAAALRSALRDFSGSVQLAGMMLEMRAVRDLLVAYPPEPGLPAILDGVAERVTVLYHDHAVYAADRDQVDPSQLHFSVGPPPSSDRAHDLVLLFLPKGREAIAHSLALLSPTLSQDGTILVVGPKKGGIRSARSLLTEQVGPVTGSRSGRHAVALTARREVADPPPIEAERRYEVDAWGIRLTVVSLPGVFSHGRLDEGTRYLLDELPLPEWTRALDVGCGAGVIGAALRRARPGARVDLVDVDARALEATRRTLSLNGLSEEGVWASDGLSAVDGGYDLVVSNPPFHQGLATDFSATNELIRTVGHHLTPEGRLVLVTNTFIDYRSRLEAAFDRVSVVARNPRYTVSEAREARAAIG
jgi:16S rRNA (guanine1207-N2)-methyltransferase